MSKSATEYTSNNYSNNNSNINNTHFVAHEIAITAAKSIRVTISCHFCTTSAIQDMFSSSDTATGQLKCQAQLKQLTNFSPRLKCTDWINFSHENNCAHALQCCTASFPNLTHAMNFRRQHTHRTDDGCNLNACEN